MIKFKTFSAIILISALILACSSANTPAQLPLKLKPKLVTEVSEGFVPLRVNQIVVYPLQGQAAKNLSPERVEAYTDLLTRAFNLSTSMEVLPNAKSLADSTKQTFFERAAKFGKLNQAQATLCGKISQLKDSDGTKFGASNPANVHFQLWLVDTKTAQPLWSAAYDSEQTPLSENILKLPDAMKNKFTYQNAQQLLADGFSISARALEDLRNQKN